MGSTGKRRAAITPQLHGVEGRRVKGYGVEGRGLLRETRRPREPAVAGKVVGVDRVCSRFVVEVRRRNPIGRQRPQSRLTAICLTARKIKKGKEEGKGKVGGEGDFG